MSADTTDCMFAGRTELQRRHVQARDLLQQVRGLLTKFSLEIDTPGSPITFHLTAHLDFTAPQIDEFSPPPHSITITLTMRVRQGWVDRGMTVETPPRRYGTSFRADLVIIGMASSVDLALRPRIKNMFHAAWRALFDQSFKALP